MPSGEPTGAGAPSGSTLPVVSKFASVIGVNASFARYATTGWPASDGEFQVAWTAVRSGATTTRFASAGGAVRSMRRTSDALPNAEPAVAVATIVCDGGDSSSVTVRHQVVPVTVAGTAGAPSMT